VGPVLISYEVGQEDFFNSFFSHSSVDQSRDVCFAVDLELWWEEYFLESYP
jgi:hypothetical protein